MLSLFPWIKKVLVFINFALSQLLNISKYGVSFILYRLLNIDKNGDLNIIPARGYFSSIAKSKTNPVLKEKPYAIISLGSNFKSFIA